MNGAEAMLHTLTGSGVSMCFANPGTSEMHTVAALDEVPGMRGARCCRKARSSATRRTPQG
jgi:acetolactate synthase-1/2/3 large subunit